MKTSFHFLQDVEYEAARLIEDFDIRPGRKPHDPVVTQLRWLEYDPSGIIHYKLNYKDQAMPLPVRPKIVEAVSVFPRLHEARLKIPLDKYLDLQALKSLMPSECHSYYDNLPHEEQSRRHEKKKAKQETVVTSQNKRKNTEVEECSSVNPSKTKKSARTKSINTEKENVEAKHDSNQPKRKNNAKRVSKTL